MTSETKGLTKEQDQLFKALTRLQQRVALGVLDGKSQRQAYEDAGGKAKTNQAKDTGAYEILSRPDVKAFVDSVLTARASKSIMSRDEALEILSGLARVSMGDLVELAPKGPAGGRKRGRPRDVYLKESALTDPTALGSIMEVSPTAHGLKIKQYSRIQAIERLAKMQGWDAAQKHDLTGHILTSEVPLTDAQRAVLDRALEEDV